MSTDGYNHRRFTKSYEIEIGKQQYYWKTTRKHGEFTVTK